MEKHEEPDDGETKTRGAQKWSGLDSTGCFIVLHVHTRYTSKQPRRDDVTDCNNVHDIYLQDTMHENRRILPQNLAWRSRQL